VLTLFLRFPAELIAELDELDQMLAARENNNATQNGSSFDICIRASLQHYGNMSVT